MTSDQLRQMLRAKPFRPFSIHLADGREILVKHSEFVLIAPSGRTAIVYQPDDSFDIVDVLLVTTLSSPPAQTS